MTDLSLRAANSKTAAGVDGIRWRCRRSTPSCACLRRAPLLAFVEICVCLNGKTEFAAGGCEGMRQGVGICERSSLMTNSPALSRS